MRYAVPYPLTRHAFFLAVLLHVLLLLLLVTRIHFLPLDTTEKPPQYYVPSYVYKGSITPAIPQQMTARATPKASQPPAAEKMLPEPATQAKKIPVQTQALPHRSLLAASLAAVQQDSAAAALSQPVDEAPILLVGDNTHLADPLIKLLGRSLSAHFSYPKMAGSFGLRGKVVVSLVLHPEGYYSNVQILESSENHDFDNAALYAINSAPKVIGADRFLDQPKRFVVGFIFD